MNNKQ
jgi:small GTP-binding protein